MTAPKNPKLKLFCELVASGKPPYAAYAAAGFKPHRSNCYLPLKRPECAAFIAELKAQRAALTEQAAAEASREFVAERKIDERFYLDKIERLARICDGTQPRKRIELDGEGKPVEVDVDEFDPNQARQCWIALASQTHGMFITQSKISGSVTTQPPAEPIANPREAAMARMAAWGSRHAASKPAPTPDAILPTPTVAETGTA
jgi:hypothetical protein